MNNNLMEGIDYYFNEAGLMVLTRHYHLQKGFCCGNGCLQCPFEFDCVPEPRRSILKEERKNNLIETDTRFPE